MPLTYQVYIYGLINVLNTGYPDM